MRSGFRIGYFNDEFLKGASREGERIRVSVRLIDVADGKSLWAESYNETYIDIFGVQESISSKVAQSLAANLSREQEQLLTSRGPKIRSFRVLSIRRL